MLPDKDDPTALLVLPILLRWLLFWKVPSHERSEVGASVTLLIIIPGRGNICHCAREGESHRCQEDGSCPWHTLLGIVPRWQLIHHVPGSHRHPQNPCGEQGGLAQDSTRKQSAGTQPQQQEHCGKETKGSAGPEPSAESG